MKFIRCMIIFAVLSAVFSVSAESAWTYDGAKTITDGFWTLTVTKVTGTDLTVTGLTGSAAEGGEEGRAIDLTDVKDKAGNVYRVVAFEGFSGQKSTTSTLWAKKDILTEFIAPDCSNVSGQYAFNQCTRLTKVALNDAADVSLSAAAFDGCASLADFAPRKVKSAGVFLFRNCEKLTGAFELTGSAAIGQEAFAGTSLERITGSNVPTVGKSAFSNCVKLKSVNFPNVTMVDERGFNGCSILEEVELPSVKIIGAYAFISCALLDQNDVNLLLHRKIEQIGQNGVGACFMGCQGIKGEIVWNMPLITAVPPSCFQDCANISRVVFKTPVSEMGGAAFKGISPGAEIYLGRSIITSYGREAVGTKGVVPYPRIYVQSLNEETLAAMEKTNATLRKEDFGNTAWVWSPGSAYTHSWITGKMYSDTATCGKVKIDNVDYPSPKVGRVYAFVAWDCCCWVIGEPPRGFSVKVR